MDQHTVRSYRFATSRADLALAPGERIMAGGTWLMSEPVIDVRGFVDISRMPWQPWERTADGLTVSATCTIADLAALSNPDSGAFTPAERERWTALPLFAQCCHALLAGWKIWNVATVGGNVARSFAAGAITSLFAGLDTVAVVWTPDGGERRIPVADLVLDNGVNSLADGEVLRAFEIPERALRARTSMRKIALAQLGRSGSVVTGRRDQDDRVTVVITAATLRPRPLVYPSMPEPADLRADVLALPDFYTDPLGSADWRRGVSAELAARVLADLQEETA